VVLTMTPQDIINSVRIVLNDATVPYRAGDPELLQRVNDALAVMVDIRPDLFTVSAPHTCTDGAEQVCTFPRLRVVQEVPRIVGGAALRVASRDALDLFWPGWYSDTPGAAREWMHHPESRDRFYLYPPAVAGQIVEVRFVQSHATLALTDTIGVPEQYRPAIEAFVVSRTESKDDEHINTGRAQAAMTDFAMMVGLAAKAAAAPAA
jgi:hypothetical protein